MRTAAHNALVGWRIIAAFLLGIAMDASLLAVCKAHFRRVFSLDEYRPVFLHSGRRNRARR
jgi:hypothetical protein